MTIRNATTQDIEKVAELEHKIEGKNAASTETLLSRFTMFPQGFHLAEEEGNVVGYVESVCGIRKISKPLMK